MLTEINKQTNLRWAARGFLGVCHAAQEAWSVLNQHGNHDILIKYRIFTINAQVESLGWILHKTQL